MNFHVIIPARFGATRLPGKPLLDIAGKPMVQHVHERAFESGATDVVIATDDERITRVARGFGARVVMTSTEHLSGSDRLVVAVTLIGCENNEIIVDREWDATLMQAVVMTQVAAATHGVLD